MAAADHHHTDLRHPLMELHGRRDNRTTDGMEDVMSEQLVAEAADDLYARVRELPSPKIAAKVLLLAHVRLTLSEGLSRAQVDQMLREYGLLFGKAYFGETKQ